MFNKNTTYVVYITTVTSVGKGEISKGVFFTKGNTILCIVGAKGLISTE